ncbi:DUF262 domain-containing protein [Candidatus Villigracilis affinis]|uniref:DUF262 domain-containing protein n=1 Tax=Candidatus Villigracilis affinis TaxID=3140682 RepID=UPI002A1D04CB|nr:DUF262 domain-containing protein [Anaerolineales bacterium]
MTKTEENKSIIAMQPQPQSKKYEVLFTGIDSGQVKIPMFQRDFVWGKEQSAKLIDSIIKGYPIGTFILWKTREELRSVRNIGNTWYLKHQKVMQSNIFWTGSRELHPFMLYVKELLLPGTVKKLITSKYQSTLNWTLMKVIKLFLSILLRIAYLFQCTSCLPENNCDEFVKNYPQYLERIDEYRSRLLGYDFSTVVIEDYPIDIACDVFTRINTGGTELTLFEIMVAKSYDNARNFDLSIEYQKLIDNNGSGKDLEDAGFETIPSSTVLQCLAACMVGQIRRKDILKIKKDKFIDTWPQMVSSLFHAVDFLRSYMRVPVSQLLPYNALVIPFTYFSTIIKIANPLLNKASCCLNIFGGHLSVIDILQAWKTKLHKIWSESARFSKARYLHIVVKKSILF